MSFLFPCACRLVNMLVRLFRSHSTVPLDRRVESLLDLKMATSLYGCGIWAGCFHISPYSVTVGRGSIDTYIDWICMSRPGVLSAASGSFFLRLAP